MTLVYVERLKIKYAAFTVEGDFIPDFIRMYEDPSFSQDNL